MYFNSCVNSTWHLEVVLEVQMGRGHSASLCVSERMMHVHILKTTTDRTLLFISVRWSCWDHLVCLFL